MGVVLSSPLYLVCGANWMMGRCERLDPTDDIHLCVVPKSFPQQNSLFDHGKRKIYIDCLPYKMSSNELMARASIFGPVKLARVSNNTLLTSRSQGLCGFVEFTTIHSFNRSLNAGTLKVGKMDCPILDAAMYSTSKQQRLLLVQNRFYFEECCICLFNESNCIFVKCGHICVCFECSGLLKKGISAGQCPLCRDYITSVVTLHR